MRGLFQENERTLTSGACAIERPHAFKRDPIQLNANGLNLQKMDLNWLLADSVPGMQANV